MILMEDKMNCCGCTACYNGCPKKCIEMKEDNEGFKYPVIDKNKCTNCGICNQMCSINDKKENEQKPEVVAAWSKEEENRKSSSSGGCFSEFAKYILQNNGIVYGAKYDENFNVIHSSADTLEELEKLKRSKYAQSDIGKTYQETKQHLENNKSVLFTGTPCQISGLYKFLGKNYENLFTCDFICHGVPSAKLYRKYTDYINKKYNSKIKEINFRNKISGWKEYSVNIELENNKRYREKASKDMYIKAFLIDINSRPSCYNCKFRGIPRIADITLGDFWGINKICPEIDDDKGISVLLINNTKGEKLIEKCKDRLVIKEGFKIEDVIRYNPCVAKPVTPHKNRNKFFMDIEKLSMEELAKKYIKKDFILKRIYRRIKIRSGKYTR